MSTTHTSEAVRTITIVALVMAVSSLASSTRRPFNTRTAELLLGDAEAGIHLQEHEIREQDDWWSIKVKCPEIDGDDNFNRAVRQRVTAIADKFKKELGLPETATIEPGFSAGYLNGTYRANVLKNGMVSVLFDYDEYTPGAVHPWGVLASINYDSRARRVLALSDLFQPRSNYVSRLSELAIASLDQHEYANKHAIRRGAGPVESNFEVFTLTNTELVLHFQQNQVAHGLEGPQQVVIPLTKLASLLRKQYRPVQ